MKYLKCAALYENILVVMMKLTGTANTARARATAKRLIKRNLTGAWVWVRDFADSNLTTTHQKINKI